MEKPDDERVCVQCKQTKPIIEFPRRKRKIDAYGKLCCACEQFNQQERYRRLAIQRDTQLQSEREETKRKELARKAALHNVHKERRKERESWYLHQPDRPCKACHQVLPATAFGGHFVANNFVLYTRCEPCHAALRKHHQPACCLCQKKFARTGFIPCFNGYSLFGDGTSISLCCKECEVAFLALSEVQQHMFIHSCCQRSFPTGQVIYAEVDPVSREIRYIGRTSNPQRRHVQHLHDASSTAGQWGPEKKLWFTLSNWIQALAEQGLTPVMEVLYVVEIAPLVVEWEQRYIWHGIQQGWKLLNVEAVDEELVARIKETPIDFLTAPFEVLVQQGFFAAHGLAAFLHEHYGSARYAE